MLTQQQVARELQRRGHKVSERTLRNWRRVGLLPSLTDRGRGRASGVERFWNDEKVIDQAIAVDEFLAKRARFESARLWLWFTGYEVDVEMARNDWLASLGRTGAEWLRNASSEEECEDALTDWATRLAKGLLRRAWIRDSGLGVESLESLLSEIFNACFNPVQTHEINVDKQIVDGVRAIISQKAKTAERLAMVSRGDLEKVLGFIRRNLSLSEMRRLIASATGKELHQAHLRWRTVVQIIKSFSAQANGGEIPVEWAQIGRRSAITFGGLCIFALLYLARGGKGSWIDSNLERIALEGHNFSHDLASVVN